MLSHDYAHEVHIDESGLFLGLAKQSPGQKSRLSRMNKLDNTRSASR